MKLLLDQGLPRSAVSYLLKQGFSCVHAGDVGLAAASDAIILDYGRKEGCVIATLDADFHALLALSGATLPSVIRVRILLHVEFNVAWAGRRNLLSLPSRVGPWMLAKRNQLETIPGKKSLFNGTACHITTWPIFLLVVP